MGTLAVLEGSNHSPEFEKIRTTYGQIDAEAMQLRGKRKLSFIQKGVWALATNQLAASEFVLTPQY